MQPAWQPAETDGSIGALPDRTWYAWRAGVIHLARIAASIGYLTHDATWAYGATGAKLEFASPSGQGTTVRLERRAA